MVGRIKNPIIYNIAIICLCFLLTSTGWLSWEYHLLGQIAAEASDVVTMVIGYLLQAAGIAIFMLLQKYREFSVKNIFIIALIVHMICLVPAILSPYLAGILIFGFLMNTACGVIAGSYLFYLTVNVPGNRKSVTFGAGYGIAIIFSWLLSIIDGGSLYYSEKVIIICAVITAVILIAVIRGRVEQPDATETGISENTGIKKDTFVIMLIMILVFCIVSNSGFAFPASDIMKSVSPEASRLIYAVGLVIAGIVTDKNRKYGAILALSSLLIPFIILALRGETISAYIFWILSYFTFAFLSVYRIVLFSDAAADKRLFYLSGMGLLVGRIGDAAGESICIALNDKITILVILTAVLFVIAIVLFFRVFPTLYMPEARAQKSEQERFMEFSTMHDLSAREQDMLKLILEKKSNGEIAGQLFISENTVKFHVKNLLAKTGCKNRNELIADYWKYSQ